MTSPETEKGEHGRVQSFGSRYDSRGGWKGRLGQIMQALADRGGQYNLLSFTLFQATA